MTNVNNLREAIKFIARWEWGDRSNGGYTNDPNDLGGETKFGISKRAYPDLDIKNLTAEKALEIYARDYWDKCACDAIPFPLCVVVFDSAVNCGVSRALGWLKDAPNAQAYIELRKRHYIDLVNKRPTQVRFIKGWFARLYDLAKFVEVHEQQEPKAAQT